MVSNDTGILASLTGFFVALFFLMSAAGIVSYGFDLPTTPTQGLSDQNATQPEDSQSVIAAVIECGVTGGLVFPPIAIADALLVDVPFVDCSRKTNTDFFKGVEAFIDTGVDALFTLIRFAFAFSLFLFQLGTASIPEVPFFVTMFIVWPAFTAMSFIGYRMIRGTGG